MVEGEQGSAYKRPDQPPEEPKNLPAAFPEKFDTEQTELAASQFLPVVE
jgi:hypothetical protein